MKNNGLFCSLFIEDLKKDLTLDDAVLGRMATLAHAWRNYNTSDEESLWESFVKPALSYLEFVPANKPVAPWVYPLYEDYGFSKCISVLYLVPPGQDIDDTAIGRFYPAKLLAHLYKGDLSWGILTDGYHWRLYSTKSSRPYEDYVELALGKTLENSDEAEYGLFERFFHRDSFIAVEEDGNSSGNDDGKVGIARCRLDLDREQSEKVMEQYVKEPLLKQIDEVLQNICNGFIYETREKKATGEAGRLEYTEEGRREIFESAVKLIYRCLFLFYAEARRLFPSEPRQAEFYQSLSMTALCQEARKFKWGQRRDYEQYDLWKHLKGLINAVNNGDPEYGIMGYDGGLFDDEEEIFLGEYQLRNNFLSRALYLLAFVEPLDNEPDNEYPIPYEDLEVRHLGELYENILEYTVLLADADLICRRNKKGAEILLASQTQRKAGDMLIGKGNVYFGESALERKQTGSYYTPEPLVRFLNQKSIVKPLKDIFELKYRQRFDELLEQAYNGYSDDIRRGAAISAVELVERFVKDELLKFKVCDPAMGSGHFLVDATNQMAGLLVGLLAEVPYTEGISARAGHPNYWRRRITRNCIYGVDLNPLAVNLAKLSLWLNCFAVEHKLTFLDHHLRCGNSLIGIRTLEQLATVPRRKKDREKKNDKQLKLFDLDDLSKTLTEAAGRIASISQIDEDDTDTQKAVFEGSLENISIIKQLADPYTAYLMDPDIKVGDYVKIFEHLAEGRSVKDLSNPALSKILKSVESYSSRHSFFHWPLEFPDVFGPDGSGGFSATVGNPPWDIVKPNSQEFFSSYDPKFRSYKKQEANRVSAALMANNPEIAERWKHYCNSFNEQSTYFKEPINYSALGNGDINTFKLFLERFFTILKKNGLMGIVVPSGIYTDQGCQPLREMFFEQSQIKFLYCFENRRGIFNIHRSFKFVLFSTKKGGKTDEFKCAFMEHDPGRLPAIDANALKMSVKQVKKFSPDTLSIMEFKNQRDIDITDLIYDGNSLLGMPKGDWKSIEWGNELHMTKYSSLLLDKDIGNNNDIPIYEGKSIHMFDSLYTSNRYWISSEEWNKVKPKSYDKYFPPEKYRLVYRYQASSTNARTLISTILPVNVVCGHSLVVSKDTTNLALNDSLYILGNINSFCLDFIVRQKVSSNINFYHVYTLPINYSNRDNLADSIIARVVRLVCTEKHFSGLWNQAFSDKWRMPEFWYPSFAPIDTYGPVHEQEIRRRLKEEAKNLTPEWGPHCGVHDRLLDRRDTGDRAQLRAEIDAYVAHLYGLSKEDFAYILDTFTVLKKKEEKVFGEFMSKRKCLEEYDRIKLILEESKRTRNNKGNSSD